MSLIILIYFSAYSFYMRQIPQLMGPTSNSTPNNINIDFNQARSILKLIISAVNWRINRLSSFKNIDQSKWIYDEASKKRISRKTGVCEPKGLRLKYK